jgi:hypothetical protein
MRVLDDKAAQGTIIVIGLVCISVSVGLYFGASAGFGLFGALMLLAGIFAK